MIELYQLKDMNDNEKKDKIKKEFFRLIDQTLSIYR